MWKKGEFGAENGENGGLGVEMENSGLEMGKIGKMGGIGNFGWKGGKCRVLGLEMGKMGWKWGKWGDLGAKMGI